MPRAIQQLLPPPPIKKATLLPPRAVETPQANERTEDFRQALKSAREKTNAAEQKPTEKSETKPAAKKTESKGAKATIKAGKPKPSARATDTTSEVDESADEQAETSGEFAPQVEAEAAEPQTSALTQPKDDVHHEDHADADQLAHDPLAAEAAAAQLVQPVDRAKDDGQPKPKDEKPAKADDSDSPAQNAASAENAAELSASATAAAAQPSPVPSAPVKAATPELTKTAATGAKRTDPASAVQQSASNEQAASAAQAAGSTATPVEATSDDTTSAAQRATPTKPLEATPIVSALGAEEAPLQPATSAPNKASRASTSPQNDLPVDPAATDDDPAVPVEVADDAELPHKSAELADVDLDAAAGLAPTAQHQPGGATVQSAKPPALPAPAPEVDFAQNNHDTIVTGVHSQLLPHGGAMEIRLDPPELGALKVMVEMRDGVMNATFQTSNEQATQLLSHSLNQLKHVLESQGVSVERLQVQQAPKNEHSSANGDRQQQQQQQRETGDDHAARQEQQRKEMLRRMWRRVSGAGDPIDYTA
jgi:flagellar hook-length control protein FliK